MRTCGHLLVAVLAWSLLAVAVSKKQLHYDRVLRNKRTACEKGRCVDFNKDEGMNCVNNCTSPACYSEVYEDEPLEDGEIDDTRNALFNQCVRKETKILSQSGFKR